MKISRLLASVAVLSLLAAGAEAQYPYPPPDAGAPPPMAVAPTLYAPPQLDQMLAPIALYPDPLLTEILTAATYPDELDQAARWVAANPGYSGPQLAASLADYPYWDPSVKSLTPFPQILEMLDQHLDWTQQMGNAFLAQQPEVMDSIQRLRRSAYDAGALRSSPYQRVVLSGGYIEVEPANPQVVYVPTYDPRRVYGRWAYAEYPPTYWGPPPGIAPRYEAGLLGFGVGIGVVDVLWHWGDWDWQHHDVRIDRQRFDRLNAGHAPVAATTWHHDETRAAAFERGGRGGQARTEQPPPQPAGRPAERGDTQQSRQHPAGAPQQEQAARPPERGAAQPPRATGAPQQAARPAERGNVPPPEQHAPGAPQQEQAARPPERGAAPPQQQHRPGAPQEAARPPTEPARPAAAPPVVHPAPAPAQQQAARPPAEPPRPAAAPPVAHPAPAPAQQQVARPPAEPPRAAAPPPAAHPAAPPQPAAAAHPAPEAHAAAPPPHAAPAKPQDAKKDDKDKKDEHPN